MQRGGKILHLFALFHWNIIFPRDNLRLFYNLCYFFLFSFTFNSKKVYYCSRIVVCWYQNPSVPVPRFLYMLTGTRYQYALCTCTDIRLRYLHSVQVPTWDFGTDISYRYWHKLLVLRLGTSINIWYQ